MMMDLILVLVRLVIAAMFAIAAVTKFSDRSGFRKTLGEFGVPSKWQAQISLLVPAIELLSAGLLIPARTAWIGGAISLATLGVFSVIVFRLLRSGHRPNCNCFGQLSTKPIGVNTLLRNGIFGVGALFVAVQGIDGAGPNALLFLVDGVSSQTGLTIMLGILVIAVAFTSWGLFNLVEQQGRLLLKIDNLELRLDSAGIAAVAREVGQLSGLPSGMLAPNFSLQGLDGQIHTLDEMKSLGLPVVLVFSDPNCGPCSLLMPDLERWEAEYADAITFAVVSRGEVEENEIKLSGASLRRVLLQDDREVAQLYESVATPSAVMINRHGLIESSLAIGNLDIAELVTIAASEPGLDAFSVTEAHRRPIGVPT